jgi:hypothetical protein
MSASALAGVLAIEAAANNSLQGAASLLSPSSSYQQKQQHLQQRGTRGLSGDGRGGGSGSSQGVYGGKQPPTPSRSVQMHDRLLTCTPLVSWDSSCDATYLKPLLYVAPTPVVCPVGPSPSRFQRRRRLRRPWLLAVAAAAPAPAAPPRSSCTR